MEQNIIWEAKHGTELRALHGEIGDLEEEIAHCKNGGMSYRMVDRQRPEVWGLDAVPELERQLAEKMAKFKALKADQNGTPTE
jgi:hypothetical protein